MKEKDLMKNVMKINLSQTIYTFQTDESESLKLNDGKLLPKIVAPIPLNPEEIKLERNTLESFERFDQKLKEFFGKAGVKHTDGKANFTMIELKDGDTANRFAAESLEQGFVVRPLGMFGLPNCIRINSGTDEQTDRAIKGFENVLTKIK